MKNSSIIFVIMGLGADKKPHAARFDEPEGTQAAKAAKLMGFQFGIAATPAALAQAKLLPKGRIFRHGKALVPITKLALYEKLSKALDFLSGAALEAAARPRVPELNSAEVWNRIAVGSVVLYGGKHSDQGWWETVVFAVSPNKDSITLRWCGALHEPAFKASLADIGVVLSADGLQVI